MHLRLLATAYLATACASAQEPAIAPLMPGWQGVPGRNLIYNPGFELGGEGWHYEYTWAKKAEEFNRTRDAKPAEIADGGADGGRCLVLPGEGTSLRSWCFPIEPGKRYGLSVQLRALPGAEKGDCLIMVFDPEWGGALYTKVDNVPANAWKRYTYDLTFKPNPQGKAYVRFASAAGVMVDTVQLEQGKATAYEAPVGLSVLRDGKPYIVRGRDQAGLRIRVVPGTQAGGGIQVGAIARDAWGREVWKQEFEAPGDKPSEVAVAAPQERLGLFHVELTARRDGSVIGIGASRYAILDPVVREEVPAGRFGVFGVCYELFNYPHWLNREAGRYFTDLGVRTTRFFAPLLEGTDAGMLTDLVARCTTMREAGITVLPCLNLFPGTGGMGESLDMPKPESLTLYRQRLGEWISAMRSEVRAVEILNEPNLWRVAKGTDRGKRTVFPRKYVAIQQAAFETIKSIDPGITVVANALNCMDWIWVKEWMQLGGAKWMDVFSFHPYRGHPDDPSMYADMKRMSGMLAEGGFKGPMLDSEFYYAANIYQERAGWEETHRNYYVPHTDELRAAGRTVRALIHHAALGVPACPFAPGITFFQFAPANALFLFDLFPAYNATARMLAGCGSGEQLETGPAFTAFLFPAAPGGPLAAVWTGQAGVVGTMRLPNRYEAFDVMGNRIGQEELAKGIRVATDPTWLRFPAGSDLAALRIALATAEVHGLGVPFSVTIIPTGTDALAARVGSRSNRPIAGSVQVLSVPAGWTTTGKAVPFTALAAGASIDLSLPIGGVAMSDLGSFPIALQVESEGEQVRIEPVLRPVFARRLAQVAVDGDVGEWTAARWVTLGAGELSKVFNAKLPRSGDADISARVAAGWTDEGLALAVVVSDDAHKPSDSERLGWQGDSIQLFVDQLADASRGAPREADDVRYVIGEMGGRPTAWLDKGAEGNFKGPANRTDGFADADVKLAIKRTDGTTTYEIVLPRTTCLPALRCAPGTSFGFSLLVNDNDGQGRKTGVTTSPAGTEPYGTPWDWPSLVLIP
ncbi:MAG: hypothetical protein J0M02_02835 [Planctomycetes bacterium]|nr:hypothetical protein [Planctomycetota bacterium]